MYRGGVELDRRTKGPSFGRNNKCITNCITNVSSCINLLLLWQNPWHNQLIKKKGLLWITDWRLQSVVNWPCCYLASDEAAEQFKLVGPCCRGTSFILWPGIRGRQWDQHPIIPFKGSPQWSKTFLQAPPVKGFNISHMAKLRTKPMCSTRTLGRLLRFRL